MSDKEIKLIVKSISNNGKKVASSKVQSEKFLKKIGILNKKSGNLTKAYKEICIPTDPD